MLFSCSGLLRATRGDTTRACCSSCQPHPASSHSAWMFRYEKVTLHEAWWSSALDCPSSRGRSSDGFAWERSPCVVKRTGGDGLHPPLPCKWKLLHYFLDALREESIDVCL